MNIFDKLKAYIKSLPFLGKTLSNAYRFLNLIKPEGQYWKYDFKAKKMHKLIWELASLIDDNNYQLAINNSENVYITLKNGINFWWTPKDPSSLLGMPLRGDFEPDCTHIITKLIRAGDIVFDVGANFGWYSCHLAQLVGETGKVHIFEPTNVIEDLKRNLSLNNYLKRCELNEAALGEKYRSEILYIPHKLGTAFASLREHSDYGASDEINVSVVRLDDYVSSMKIEKVDFIKIDAEGAEYQVLKGARNVLKNYSPVIMMELQDIHTKYFNYSPEEVINYIKDLDYHLYEINDKEIGSVEKVTSFRNTSNYNFLAIKNDNILRRNGVLIR